MGASGKLASIASAQYPSRPMSAMPEHPRDPTGWTTAIAFGFFLLCMLRLTIPSHLYFDEIHYVPAARKLLALVPANQEHPMLAKEIIAAGIALLGDNPWGWRFFSLIAGAITLLAFMRAMWFTTLSRFATIAGGLLVSSGFALYIQSRIAMLDIFMAAFLMLAVWQTAAVMRLQTGARWRLALTGMFLGCAIACKWNAAPIAFLIAFGFFIMRIEDVGGAFLTSRRGRPVQGIHFLEAMFWLCVVPVLVYFATFTPMAFYHSDPVPFRGFIHFQKTMVDLQESVRKPHLYQSQWLQWIANWRPIWYLYEVTDGARRGVLLLGNPFSMLAGLAAFAWCAFVGVFRRRWDALAIALFYAVSIGFWMIAAKPVQFYYHYMVPSFFLMAALALALDELWKKGRKRWALAALALAFGMFAWFFPILSSAPLHGGQKSYETYTWLQSWR
jgi:dolichyl-phosphate-mannose--protein O-mannosyl transferase